MFFGAGLANGTSAKKTTAVVDYLLIVFSVAQAFFISVDKFDYDPPTIDVMRVDDGFSILIVSSTVSKLMSFFLFSRSRL